MILSANAGVAIFVRVVQHGQHLEANGDIACRGQMIEPTIVPVPRQRNSQQENEAVKAGNTPDDWEQKPAKNRQKYKDAWRKANRVRANKT